jgi:primosomal protein N'
MFVLEIIPLSRTAPPHPLSYRSREKVVLGTIVSVPLRKKTVPGLVVGSVPVREAKAELKTASFSLSRSATEHIGVLPAGLITAGKEIAAYYATTLGAVLSALLIPVLPETLPSRFAKGGGFEIEHIEMPTLARRKRYETLVKKTEKGVTLLVVPTQAEADEWALLLKSQKPLIISGKLSGKRRDLAIARACGAGLDKDHRLSPSLSLIITTPGFSWIPVPHLTRIIIERVSAGTFALPKRPHVNIVFALTELARVRDIPLAYGDYPLPLEYRTNPGKSLKAKDAPLGIITILDTRSRKEDGKVHSTKEGGAAWKAIPGVVRDDIKKTIEGGGRAAVLAVRRGYAPTVVCRDCGTAVTDEFGRTLSLVTINGVRLLRSTDGTSVESAKTLCKNCGSWNLMPLGVGVERVEEELGAAFPDTSLVRIDQDSMTSRTKLLERISEPGTIIIGTESMLSWISPEYPIDLGVVASADSLLSLPFWRARERFVRIGLMFAERAKRVIVATRHPETDAVLSALTSPSTSEFWQEELALRKALNYPPFGTLIVFQVEGTSARIADARAAINEACAPLVPIHLAPRAISASVLRGISVLQLPEGVWPHTMLSEQISRLSPAIRVHIDSESLW